MLRIPLIIELLEGGNKRTENKVSLIEQFPTILNIADADVPDSEYFKNLRLFEDREYHEFIYAEVGHKPIEPVKRRHPRFSGSEHDGPLQSIRDEDYKLIRLADGSIELYDWQNDPKETQNLVEELPDVAEALEEQLLADLQIMKSSCLKEEVDDPQHEKQLKNLGYL